MAFATLIAESFPLPPRSEADNERLIELLSGLDEREDLPPEEEAFAELLAIVIQDYEDKHYALPAVPPHEALKALMEDRACGIRMSGQWWGTKGSLPRS